ncbi:MAG: MarR family transcriptional regulator, partial [Firmicutes bacterium]|nr:MarR family transcriptional regulator [Bacillota bacterium]
YRTGNRKTIHLAPTEKAAPIIADGCIVRDTFSRILLDGFTAEEADALIHSIQKLTDNVSRYLEQF